MKKISLVIAFLLSSCAIDYRTDYERNNNIVLTEEQIEFRKEQRELEHHINISKLRAKENRERIQRMINCNFQSNTSCI